MSLALKPLRPYPALLVLKGEERIMVASDFHIGWELALIEKGIHVPSQTSKILKTIGRLIENCKPTSILFLGDMKHSVATTEVEEWRDVPDFFEKIRSSVEDVKIIRGNHDGNLESLTPTDIPILPPSGITIQDAGFFHGHTWPSPELLGCSKLFMGHVHPMAEFRDPMGFRVTRRVWVEARCDGEHLARVVLEKLKVKVDDDTAEILMDRFGVKLKTSQLFIIPSFNEFLGGYPMNGRRLDRGSRYGMFISPVLRSRAVDVDNAELYLVDGTFLGSVSHLRNLM